MPDDAPKKKKIHWKKLRHAGVLFPPDYVPHRVPLIYKGKKVKLTPAQEEVATMYAAMLDTDYVKKPVLRANFWEGFKQVLGPGHTIKGLEGCNFRPIWDHLQAEKERKKALSKEDKKAIKEAKDAEEAVYKTALVDGRPETVGNFRVEPPGLFRGRGDHPKMGMIKKRIYPPDVIINIGKGEPVPKHPYMKSSMKWKEVIHDPTVTWLARWNDTINPRDIKYVWFAATSKVKAESDQAKYEKAKELKRIIKKVRANYEADFDAPMDSYQGIRKRQMATALYLIDRLALRAGHEKGDDEADTVGTCTLKVQNVELLPSSTIRLDFLGKDSIKYENTVKVDKRVYRNIKAFVAKTAGGKKKSASDMLFDTFDANDLNKELKSIMPGLSAKVFRTYNASSTLDQLLNDPDDAGSQELATIKKKALYDKANKEVAVLCNHQKAVPKGHSAQVEKLQEKIMEQKAKLKEVRAEGKGKDDEKTEKKVEKIKEQIKKLKLQIETKEDLKQVALGTSKINYLDPRITVAWCKRAEMPIEKVFNKTLLNKFGWAMETGSKYRF